MLLVFGWVREELVGVTVARVYINSGNGWTYMDKLMALSTVSLPLARINLTSKYRIIIVVVDTCRDNIQICLSSLPLYPILQIAPLLTFFFLCLVFKKYHVFYCNRFNFKTAGKMIHKTSSNDWIYYIYMYTCTYHYLRFSFSLYIHDIFDKYSYFNNAKIYYIGNSLIGSLNTYIKLNLHTLHYIWSAISTPRSAFTCRMWILHRIGKDIQY